MLVAQPSSVDPSPTENQVTQHCEDELERQVLQYSLVMHLPVKYPDSMLTKFHVCSGGAAYCDGCYAANVLPKCAACSQPISDRALKAFDTQWHVKCFVCEVRSSNIVENAVLGEMIMSSPPALDIL